MRELNLEFYHPMHCRGFTLLELSIVLVIVGLIIGGITVGQEMIHQSQIGRVVKDAQTYKTAYNTFRLKYNKKPGDMVNAFSYWGANCGNNTDIAGDDSGCNGNGNGDISGREAMRAWKHLELSGINPFSSPLGFPPQGEAVSGGWLPKASLQAIANGPAGFEFKTRAVPEANWDGNTLHIGGTTAGGGSPLPNRVYSIEDSKNIDIKIDDGMPYRGKMLSDAADTFCVNMATLEYDLAAGTACQIFFTHID